MNKSFLRFNDTALKSGLLQLNSNLARELKQTTETFVALAKSAAAEGNHEDDEQADDLDPSTALHDAAFTARAHNDHSSSTQVPVPQHTDIGWGYTAMVDDSSGQNSVSPAKRAEEIDNFFTSSMSASPYRPSPQTSIVRRRVPLTVGQVLDQSKNMSTTPTTNQSQLPFGLVDLVTRDPSPYHSNPQMFSVNIPTPDVTPPVTRLPTPPLIPNLSNSKTIAPIFTYSHDETTFARRLTRAALETGFHLLSTAAIRPAALNYVFKLSLPYMNLDALRERFKVLLARGTHEELDCWETPFIHLGGAGTHYPRKDADGNIIPIPNSWNVRSIGPLPAKMIRAENTVDPSQSHDLQIDLTGFEGEWFDAHDVQGYLEEEKGCFIDPKDSFAEVLIEVDEVTPPMPLGTLFKSSSDYLDFASPRRPSHPLSESPGLSNGSSASESVSTKSTPQTNVDIMFGSGETFGLDMGTNFSDVGKFNDVDLSAMFDQPLGLDLAPPFDASVNGNLEGFDTNAFRVATPGLDFLGGEVEIPIVRQKQKKTAWIDVSKLIDGESFLRFVEGEQKANTVSRNYQTRRMSWPCTWVQEERRGHGVPGFFDSFFVKHSPAGFIWV